MKRTEAVSKAISSRRVTARARARVALRAGGALAFLLTFSAIVNAAPPHVWAPGDKLASADLNKNFSEVDARLATIEAPPAFLQSVSGVAEAGGIGEAYVYSAVSVLLTPGTWLVEAHATISTTMSTDGVQLGLRNTTTSTDIDPSRSAAAQTTAVDVAVALTTTAVVTVATATEIQMKAYPHGTSVVHFGSANLPGFTEKQRLFAVKLR